ncbi:MAG: hypothetical protein J4F30_04115 [Acidobacteria bacterium]|nr:hypothetical protein [Acidobacteriota bacterium]
MAVCLRLLRVVAAVTVLALLLPPPAAGQGRTPWGDPDLQGVWANDVVTPLERPSELGERLELTDEELAEAAAANERRRLDDGGPRPGDPILLQGYNQFWMPARDVSRQTSLVVDPPDGRVPLLTAAGVQREALALESSQGVPAKVAELRRHNDGPEGRSLWERCLTRGVPRMPDFYNNGTLVLQTPDHVVIHMEMIHETRVIPLDRRPHIGAGIRQWHGDPRGRWEGETLVVETTNFSTKTNFKGSQDGLHLVERFSRADGDTLLYEVTVTDPDTWTRPWTVRFPIRKSDGPLFEYACHEGNYAMFNTLAGARAAEEAKGDR